MSTESSDLLAWEAFRVAAISLIQVLVFVTLYEAVVEVYVSNFGQMNKIFGFEMQIDASIYLLSILAGVNSLAQIFLKRRLIKAASPLMCAAGWIIYWGNIADVVPNRFILLSILGMISFYVGAVLGFREPQVAERIS